MPAMVRLGLRVLAGLSVLLAALPAAAQQFGPADLAGTWAVVQLATPAAGATASSIRAYRGEVALDGDGVVQPGGTLADDLSRVFTITGNVSVTSAGVVTATLGLADVGGPAGAI